MCSQYYVVKTPHVLDKDDEDYLNNFDYSEQKKRKRPHLLIILFIIILITLFGVIHFLQNFIASERLESYTLTFKDINIIFSENVLEQVQEEYVLNQDREIKACLYGTVQNNNYVINKIDFPKILNANVFHVESYSCPVDAIADLHSHPKNSCIASEQDLKILEQRRTYDPDFIMLIMCSQERFSLIK